MTNCKYCIFGHICCSEQPCEDYVPVDREHEDEMIADQLESEKSEYYDAYIEYISEYSDSNFDLSC